MFMKSFLFLASRRACRDRRPPANDRYRQRPPVVVSPDLSAPWVMQLGAAAAAATVLRRQQRR